jgi:hypothetical protein
VLNPLGQPIPATNLNPNVSPPEVSTPYSPIVLPLDVRETLTDTSEAPIDETPVEEAPTEEAPTDETDTVDETTDVTGGKTPEEIARLEERRERARKKRRAARRAAIAASKVTPTTETSTVLPEVLKTQFLSMPSSLTSLRGAGEIESAETGKKRKNVWNEESLRLKDALGL